MLTLLWMQEVNLNSSLFLTFKSVPLAGRSRQEAVLNNIPQYIQYWDCYCQTDKRQIEMLQAWYPTWVLLFIIQLNQGLGWAAIPSKKAKIKQKNPNLHSVLPTVFIFYFFHCTSRNSFSTNPHCICLQQELILARTTGEITYVIM